MTTTESVSVTVSRRFQASAERVFDAWLDVEAARRWLFTMPDTEPVRAEIDARVGGAFTFVDRRGGAEVVHEGTFLEIDRPRRLRLRFWVADQPDAVDMLTVGIDPDGDGCRLTLVHELHPDWAAFEAFTNNAWEAMFDMLTDHLDVAPADRFTLTRLVDAPRPLVWKAWTDPAHLQHWWGPFGCVMTALEADIRQDGVFRVKFQSDDGTGYWLRCVYREMDEPGRLVFSHGWENAAGEGETTTLVTVTFEAVGGRTRIILTQQGFVSLEATRTHRDGWSESLQRLLTHLTGRVSFAASSIAG